MLITWRALRAFRAHLPELRAETAGQAWPMRLLFYLGAFRVYRLRARVAARYARRVRPGDPAQRASCCDPRPAEYPQGTAVSDLPELASLQEAAQIGWVRYYDCSRCGQGWMQTMVANGKAWDPQVIKHDAAAPL